MKSPLSERNRGLRLRSIAKLLPFVLLSITMAKTVPDHPSSAPVAQKIPHVLELHGERRLDNYFWLREKTNKAVTAYLEAENAYTEAIMKPTEPLQKKLYKEMVSRIKETDSSVPYSKGEYVYYSRTEKGKQYPVHCRKKRARGAREEITLDLNALAKGQKFLGLGAYRVSDDGNWLAYSVDNTGFREYTLYIKDLKTGRKLPEKIEKTGHIAWAADNQTFFYTVEDAAKRQYRVYRHRLGERNDDLIFEEKDEMFDVDVARSRSGEYLFLNSNSKTSSEVRYARADNPGASWKIVASREPDHEYEVDHHGNRFYIRSNNTGRNFHLVSAPVDDPRPRNWQEIIPHRTDVMLSGMDLFQNFYVLQERENGLPRLKVRRWEGGEPIPIDFPEPSYDIGPDENEEWQSQTYRYAYESMITPRSVMEYDLRSGKSIVLKRTVVKGGFKPENYRTERIHARAADGTAIPISLVYAKAVRRDGKAPLLLGGYGAYGIPNDVHFSSSRLSLLDRGMIMAIAHIRGGGELGKPWHDAGKMMRKKNTFTDFIDCAEHLIQERWTSSDRLIIQGGSAGGLLMGAVTNMRPDLFKAVVAQVPFVDVINTMYDESLPLTVTEFEEWGNPKKKAEYDYIKSYCPYSNLAAKDYPAILVKTSLNDSAVMYWEPAKYTAKLRSLKTDKNPLLLKTNMAAGHGGASGRYDYLKEVAFDYAFALWQAGLAR